MAKRKKVQCEGQLSLFDLDVLPITYQTPEELIEALRHSDVYRYRTRTIKAGNMLECEIYPIWKTGESKRAKEKKPSRKAQENLNHKNTKKKIMRLTNENFTDADLWGTFGYNDRSLPATPEAARRDMQNFIRRLKNKRKKQGLPDIRYLYVTEWHTNGEGEAIRCHHHIILSGDMDRDEIEKTWNNGNYPQTRRLRVKEDCGLCGLAAYLSKGGRHEKMWGHSTNLKPPKETIADHKVTKRQAERIALDVDNAPAIFERACKGYAFRVVEIKRSNWVAGVYIYVQMYKRK